MSANRSNQQASPLSRPRSPTLMSTEQQEDCVSGILAQTLASSPCVKLILAARIRSPHFNDVVMIGHSSIHLREFTQSGHLTNIIADLELGTQILAAKVVSAEAHVLSAEDAVFENGKDEFHYKIRGEPCGDSEPPQIVVLSTASSELVFIYARTLPNGTVQFVYAKKQILGGKRWPRRYGKHLAIDRESRVLAVAATKGSFGILSLKDVDEIKTHIDAWNPRDPTSTKPMKEQRFIQVDGLILRMDFLRSTTTQPNRVVLLLIVANQGVTRLLLYRWDSWLSLSTVSPLRCSGQPLCAEDSFPHLLIPSCRFASFAVVTKNEVVFYDDVNSKLMKRSPIPFNAGEQKDKLWVQWVNPVRHAEHRKKKEDIVLIREDGRLFTLVVTHNHLKSRHSASFAVGDLAMNVDTAVCALQAPPATGGDIVIACGDRTEGGVFSLTVQTAPLRLQTIPNWSPINNVIHLDYKSSTSSIRDHGLIIAATGARKDRAALTELRYGVEAQINWTIRLEEAMTIDRLWALERSVEGRLLFLASHHEYTSLMYYDLDTGELASVDSMAYPQLCYTSPTLSAANIPGDAIIQITSNRAYLMTSSGRSCVQSFETWTEDLVCADIFATRGLFLVAGRQGTTFHLLCGAAAATVAEEPELSLLDKSLAIDFVPVDLALAEVAGSTYCIAGSQNGWLYLYGIDPVGGISNCKAWSLSNFTPSLKEPSISSISMLKPAHMQHCLVLCGLKTGELLLFQLKLVTGDRADQASLSLIHTQTLGSTSVFVKIDSKVFTDAERSAYVTCGPRMSRVLVRRNQYGLDFSIDSILVTDKANPSYISPTINAVDRIGHFAMDSDGDPSGLLACAAGDDILLLGIGTRAMVPRPIHSTHPTKSLIFSPHLKKCITVSQDGSMAMNKTSISQAVERPALQLYDPNPGPEDESPYSKSTFYFGEKGQTVRVLLSWAPTDGASHFDMIIIGSDEGPGPTGRLSFMSASRMAQSKPGKPSAKTIATYENKSISAICAFGMSSLVVCTGRELKILHLDMSTKRFQHQGQAFELPSRAMDLKAKGSVIYVATSLHSFLLVRVDEDRSRMRLIASDSYAGKARNIVPFGTSSLLVNLVSDHGSRILGFSQRPTCGTSPSFEAVVPQAIDRLMELKLPNAAPPLSRDKTTHITAPTRFLGTTIDGTLYLLTTLSGPELALLTFLEQLCEPMRDAAAKSASILAQAIALKYAGRLEEAGVAMPSLGALAVSGETGLHGTEPTCARGDVLRGLLEVGGPYALRSLLLRQGRKIKSEGEGEGEGEVAELRRPRRDSDAMDVDMDVDVEMDGVRVKKENGSDAHLVMDELESLRQLAKPVLGHLGGEDEVLDAVTMWLRAKLSPPSF